MAKKEKKLIYAERSGKYSKFSVQTWDAMPDDRHGWHQVTKEVFEAAISGQRPVKSEVPAAVKANIEKTKPAKAAKAEKAAKPDDVNEPEQDDVNAG